jgi:uncharacterized protein (DUF169 family)
MDCYNFDMNGEVVWHELDYGSKYKHAKKGVHFMNKNEAKLCRKLMAETGLTEEELRTHKTYRVQLSAAQKEGEKAKNHKIDKFKRKVMKEVTKELKLAKEHPDCIALYKEKMEKRLNDDPYRKPWWLYGISTKWDLK